MKYKIVADSSCDVKNDYLKDKDIEFSVVPLTILVGNQEFVDDDNIDTNEFLTAVEGYPGKTSSSCPSPGVYAQEFSSDVDGVFCITISSKLSGSYNSACNAKEMVKNKNIHVIDSKLTSGSMILIIDRLVELIEQNLPYEEIVKLIDEYRDNMNLLFVLNKFDVLVKNGRMSKLTSIIATALFIKPLCSAIEGEIKIIEKPRTLKTAYKRIIANIKERVQDFKSRVCIITHCMNEEAAVEIKEMITAECDFKQILIRPMKGLCSYYAMRKGVIVSF